MASNASNTGGYDYKFVDPPPDKLVCQICLLVARIPYQVMCCGRVYCQACLDEHKKHSSTCPNCRKTGQNFPDIRGEWTSGSSYLIKWHGMLDFLPEFLPIGEQEIKALKVKCNNSENGCSWVGELRSLDDHLTTCEYALLNCPNKCVKNKKEVHVLRCNLDHHLKNKCPNRQYQCPHCKDTGRHCDITTTHLDTCPKVKVPCPNSNCLVSVPRCDLSAHRSTCEFEKVSCKYTGIGCTKEPLRKELQQHEEDDTFHLHLAIETVNKQQEKIKVMADNTIAGQSGPCLFKMPQYYQHKSSKQAWYSPPFYTNPGGYKMCIRVDANGNGNGAGTHVSVFVYLMKGRNDDNLPWPFTGEVTIALLNQLANENHYTHTFSFPQQDNEASRRVVDGEMAPTGYGIRTFISHDRLDHNADQNCQYLKDDCLYFRIKVQASKPTKPWLTSTV